MAYSRGLADRVRHALRDARGIAEKKLFGGVGFLLRGNLLVAVWQTSLIARLGPEQAATALAESNVREFDVTGRPMRGWVMIDADGLDNDAALDAWIARARAFVETLPAK
jgi:hypothetical protein